MHKVTVRLVGGLGNQLHCYAFGLALAEKHNVSLEVDCYSNFWNQQYGKVYLLDNFPSVKVDKINEPQSKFGKLFFRLKLKIVKSVSLILPLFLRTIVDEGEPTGFKERIFNTRYFFNPYLMGYWCSYRYYNEIEQTLRAVLSPPAPNLLRVKNMLSVIRSGLSCFIHFRGYLEEQGPARASMKNFYNEAIVTMKTRFPDIRFYVFSDDHKSAREQLSDFCDDLHFVDLKESVGDRASLNDFYLMYACDHAIIGDSTFSWWAAWLGDTERKLVIAPRGLSPWGDDWVPDHWLAINAVN